MKSPLSLLFGLLLLSTPIWGQMPFKFRPVSNIPVSDENGDLTLAWAGGLNSGQYNTIDLNGDGNLDLVVFDRTSDKLGTFINTGSEYLYSPQYEYLFPNDLHSWIMLADYDCDGKKDLFANTTFGLKVYKNVFGETLNFELQVDPLVTESGSLLINLQVSASDIPAISDIDGDGDLDILVFNFATGGTVEYHQNQSMQLDGTCNHLSFKQITDNWGNFQECDCGVYAFGQTCEELGGRQAHAGGKSLLTLDQDHDGDQELIFGDEFCTNIAFLRNQGDANNAIFTEALLEYPQEQNPVDFFIFPALYREDVNFDGRKDLIAAPNLFENLGRMVNFRQSSHLYTNSGLPDEESFTWQQDDWLQSGMIDLGEGAVPLFFDHDGDNDLDLVIGSRGSLINGEFFATFELYENQGSPTAAAFQIQSRDYLNLGSARLQDLKPSFADLNGDGTNDLIFAAAASNGQTSIYYFLNSLASGFSPQSTDPLLLNFTLQSGDFPHFHDLNDDGRADILLGKRTGRLEYWQNTALDAPFGFELINESLAGITDDSFRRDLVPLASDLNGDGLLELATLDATGILRVYTNFLSVSDPDPLEEFSLVLEAQPGSAAVESRWGRGASLTGTLLSEGLPHIVVGSNQGGLFLLENLSDPLNGPNPEPLLDLKVFPNPADHLVEFRANQAFSWKIYNTLGQLIQVSPENVLNSRYIIEGNVLRDGIYLIKAITGSGLSATRKLLVVH